MLQRSSLAVLLALASGLASLAVHTAARAVDSPLLEGLKGEELYDNRERHFVQSRSLLDTAAAPTIITQVSTTQELIDALKAGFQDIEIIEHLDASAFPLIDAIINSQLFKHQLPPQTSKTRSIRGYCLTAPSLDLRTKVTGAPLLALKPNQCIILVSNGFLPLTEGKSWLDNVYFRYATSDIGESAVKGAPPFPLHVHSGEAFISNIVIQGDGIHDLAAFLVFPSASVLMLDSIMSDLKLTGQSTAAYGRKLFDYGSSAAQSSQDGSPAAQSSPVVDIKASPTFFLRTQFLNIDLPASGHVILGDTATNILLQECQFSNISATRPLGAIASSTFYSDGNETVGNNAGGEANPPNALPLSLSAGQVTGLLDQWDEFYIATVEAVNSTTARRIAYTDAVAEGVGIGPDRNTPKTPDTGDAHHEKPSPKSNDDESNSKTIGISIAGAILLVGIVAGIVWYLNKRQRQKERDRDRKQAEQAAGPYGGPNHYGSLPHHMGAQYGAPGGYANGGAPGWGAPPGYGGFYGGSADGTQTNFSNASSGGGKAEAPKDWRPHAGPPPGPYAGTPQYGMHSSNESHPSLAAISSMGTGPKLANPFPQAILTANFDDFTNLTNLSYASSNQGTSSSKAGPRDPGEPVGPLPDNASIEDKIERLHKQLDSMYAVKKPLLGQYEVLSHGNRRQGGQGVVQFARGVTDQLDYAIKFFVSKRAFDEEGNFYRNSPLGTLLPKCLALCANDDGAETDAHGIPMPSFLIMERGESLDEWSRRAKPDNFQAVAMLANIAKRLSHMHEAGFVHRDLKPGNVMWLPRENRWTVIDFGCVAKVGERTSICYSLRYTAPEVIQALDRQEKTIIADPAVDCWALGVMAYELLTGGPAFQVLVDGPKQIIAQLKGDAELPWEGQRANQEVMRKLRSLRKPVEALLERDPALRPSMLKFCDQCDDIFGTRTLKG